MLSAYFEMPRFALLASPGAAIPSTVEVGSESMEGIAWVERVVLLHGLAVSGRTWSFQQTAAPLEARAVYDEMMRSIDRPWAERWRQKGGQSGPAFEWARDRALSARSKHPGPAYQAEEGVAVTARCPPWAREITIPMESGEVYVARDEIERERLAEVAAVPAHRFAE